MERLQYIIAKNKVLESKVDKLQVSINVLAQRECSDLPALLRSAASIFDANDPGLLNSQIEKNLDRLKFIGYLHDFSNIKKHARFEESKIKKDIRQSKRKQKDDDDAFERKLAHGINLQTSTGDLEPELDLDEVEKILEVKTEPYKEKTFQEIVNAAYYPKLHTDKYNKFSKSPKSAEEVLIEQYQSGLKKELLFFHSHLDFENLNPFHQEIFTGYINRTLN